jgi:hydrogenase maturation factor HypF (carbamoyltransferase family)
MGPVTAHLGVSVPAQVAGPETRRRRARVHLDGGGPAVVPVALGATTDLAAELGLGGFVRADPHGLTVEVEGGSVSVTEFLRRISAGPHGPCWSSGGELAPLGAPEFAVLAVSARRTAAAAHRGTDVALCAACVVVLFDRAHLRFLDPTIGCPACRPDGGEGRSKLRLVGVDGRPIEGNPLKSAMALLLVGGRIVATRDALRTRFFADATRPAAVAALAAMTARTPESRMVVLCPDVEWARRLAVVDEAEAAALTSRRNPVLLLEPLPVGPARELAPPDSQLPVTLPGCGMTHLMARAAARPLAYLDLPAVVGAEPGASAPAIGMLLAEPVI